MQAPMAPSAPLASASCAGAGEELPTPTAQKAGVIHSTDLFKGHKTVEIKHNGLVYRLQATKMGKLILTK